jgi:hypothetical protein
MDETVYGNSTGKSDFQLVPNHTPVDWVYGHSFG